MKPVPLTTDAAELLTAELDRRPPSEHDAFLRELLACTAGALGVIHGSRPAAEAVYALGDHLAAAGSGR